MGIDKTSYTEMIKYLESEIQAGNRWAAFEGYELPWASFFIQCFESSIDAANFCGSCLYRTGEDGELEDIHYNFYAIENLIKEFQLAQGLVPTMVTSPAIVESMLQQQGIIAFSDRLHPLSAPELAYGCILPVMKPLVITPVALMDQFHIVRHAHQSIGLIYELGHSHRILHSFPEYGSAEKVLELFARELPDNNSKTWYDLILVGQFKDLPLRLNYEGFPKYNTGLPLKNAFYSDSDGILKIHSIHDPHKEMTINQRLFARYNEAKGEVVYLDDCLREIIPGASVQSFVESDFRSNLGILLPAATAPKQQNLDLTLHEASQLLFTSVEASKRILKIAGLGRGKSRDRKRRRHG